jgi:hypothetical protein
MATAFVEYYIEIEIPLYSIAAGISALGVF